MRVIEHYKIGILTGSGTVIVNYISSIVPRVGETILVRGRQFKVNHITHGIDHKEDRNENFLNVYTEEI